MVRQNLFDISYVCVSAALVALVTMGCASKPKQGEARGLLPKSAQLSPVSINEPVVLKLKGVKGRIEQIHYFHKSSAKTFSNSELQKTLQDSLEFVSSSEVSEIDPDGDIKQTVTVLRKDGTANLHHFAMPELNEKLDIHMTPLGKILKSGKYPENSLFYVPSVSLPEGPVHVGDTWSLRSRWVAMDEGIPFVLDMISILKGMYQCGKEQCAEIELSGDVALENPGTVQADAGVQFKSEWRGKLLFAVGTGTVVWSKVNSDEKFLTGTLRREVQSCLESVLQLPEGDRLPGVERAACDDFVIATPAEEKMQESAGS